MGVHSLVYSNLYSIQPNFLYPKQNIPKQWVWIAVLWWFSFWIQYEHYDKPSIKSKEPQTFKKSFYVNWFITENFWIIWKTIMFEAEKNATANNDNHDNFFVCVCKTFLHCISLWIRVCWHCKIINVTNQIKSY